MPHLSNSRPMSRSIHGKAFSWPTRPARRRIRSARRARRSARAGGGPCRRSRAATFSKRTPVSLPSAWVNSLGTRIVEDRDALVHRVLLLPGRRLHLLEAGAHDDLHVLAAEAARGAAAIHRGVAAAEHDHAPADLVDVAEGDARQPVDADMDVGRGLLRGRECRGRGRAARRCRRRSRRSPRRGSPARLSTRLPKRVSMPPMPRM